MKILLSTGSLYHLELENIFSISSRYDFDGIELKIQNLKVDIAEVKRLSREYQQPIYGIHAPFFKSFMGSYIISPESATKKMLRVSVHIAKGLNVDVLTLHPFPAFLFRAKARETMKRILGELQNHCKGLKIAIENMPVIRKGFLRLEPYALNTFPELLEFSRGAGCYLTLDTAHCGTRRVSPSKVYESFEDGVANIHLSDFKDGREHLPMGSGNIDFTSFFRSLKRSKYNGFLTLELDPNNFKNTTTIGECKKFINKGIQESGHSL